MYKYIQSRIFEQRLNTTLYTLRLTISFTNSHNSLASMQLYYQERNAILFAFQLTKDKADYSFKFAIALSSNLAVTYLMF